MILVVVAVLSIALLCSLCVIAFLMKRNKAPKNADEKRIKIHAQLQVGQQPGAANGDSAGDEDGMKVHDGIEGYNMTMEIERVIDDQDADVIELVNKTADIMDGHAQMQNEDDENSLLQEIN